MCVHTVTWERHSKSNFCSEASNGLQNCSQWKPSSWSLSTSFKKKIQHQTNRRHRQALLERMEWHLQVCTGPMPPPVYKVGGRPPRCWALGAIHRAATCVQSGGVIAPMLGSGCYTQSRHLWTKWWGDHPEAGLWALYTAFFSILLSKLVAFWVSWPRNTAEFLS